MYYNQTFVTCPNMDIIKDDLWVENKPDNGDYTERCVRFLYSTEFNGLDDIYCGNKYPYICEFEILNPKT
ncbi:hypothetical protein B566_EDAN002422 [Ephemera danica]|nr:hypothetical protein B566_EDAN002422 [Ephemera danica]